MANGKVTQSHFFIDTNGAKKPNKVGVDVYVFFMELREDKASKSLSMAGANQTSKTLITNSYSGCYIPDSGSGNTTSGLYCAALIQKNGWKIPTVEQYVQWAEDQSYRAKYPWKF